MKVYQAIDATQGYKGPFVKAAETAANEARNTIPDEYRCRSCRMLMGAPGLCSWCTDTIARMKEVSRGMRS